MCATIIVLGSEFIFYLKKKSFYDKYCDLVPACLPVKPPDPYMVSNKKVAPWQQHLVYSTEHHPVSVQPRSITSDALLVC